VEISLVTRDQDGFSITEVSGEVDVHTAPDLDQRLSEVIEAGSRKLVVDLSAVDFLDSTGLGVLVKALKEVRDEAGSVAVVATTDRITKVFRITGLDSVIGLYESVEQAVGS
jgi:anti-sigma B factor antagonist